MYHDSIIRCFADDTRISIAIKSEHDVKFLQKDLQNVIDWSEGNDMALHKNKVHVSQIQPRISTTIWLIFTIFTFWHQKWPQNDIVRVNNFQLFGPICNFLPKLYFILLYTHKFKYPENTYIEMQVLVSLAQL